MANKYSFKTDEQNVWFISDTHFYHEKIIQYCSRPYANGAEMTEALIENWNSVVGPNDIVFHLGDVGFTNIPTVIETVKRLNGKIYLVTGNHDRKAMQNEEFRNLFEAASAEMYVNVDGQQIYLNHKPLLCFDGIYNTDNPTWQLFGHVHSGPNSTGLDNERLKFLLPVQYDVGVDNNNYTPISFAEVKEKISAKLKARANN